MFFADIWIGALRINPSNELVVWWSALLSIGILSFLYRDNLFYKYIEHIFVGVSAGFWFTRLFWDVLYKQVFLKYFTLFNGLGIDSYLRSVGLSEQVYKFHLELPYVLTDIPVNIFSKSQAFKEVILVSIPFALGILILTKLIPKFSWLSRLPISFIVGITASITIYTAIQSDILPQIGRSLLPISEPSLWSVISSIILVIGVLTSLLYFYFSVEHKGALLTLTKIGVIFLMITFGASFGYSVMARISLVLRVFQFLINDWLGMTLIY